MMGMAVCSNVIGEQEVYEKVQVEGFGCESIIYSEATVR